MTEVDVKRVYTQTFGVAAAILEREGNILLVKESNPSHPDHGKWNQPAGWIDVGEDPIEAVKREVKEESGYTFTPEALLGIYSFVRNDMVSYRGSPPHGIKILYVGSISGVQNDWNKDEISEVRWFTPKEIYAMDEATLRDADIKKEVHDYFAGVRFPLAVVTHTVQEK